MACDNRCDGTGCSQSEANKPIENRLEELNVRKEKRPGRQSLDSTCSKSSGSQFCCRTKQVDIASLGLREKTDRKRLDNVFSRDLIIGFSDGLTVPFALTAGLSSLGSSHLVVIGGLAELFSGAISMGIGGYFSTKAERDNYRYLLRQTRERVELSCSEAIQRELLNILGPYGFTALDVRQIAKRLRDEEQRSGVEIEGGSDARGLTSFLLRFGEGVETISTWRIYASAITIGLSYFIGGLIPMIPYFAIPEASTALFVSIGVTGVILIIFGAIKGYLTGSQTGWIWLIVSAVQTLAVGAFAAAASYGIVRALDG